MAALAELGEHMEYVFAVDCWQVARAAHNHYWGKECGEFPTWADDQDTIAALVVLGQLDIWQCSLKCNVFLNLACRGGDRGI